MNIDNIEKLIDKVIAELPNVDASKIERAYVFNTISPADGDLRFPLGDFKIVVGAATKKNKIYGFEVDDDKHMLLSFETSEPFGTSGQGFSIFQESIDTIYSTIDNLKKKYDTCTQIQDNERTQHLNQTAGQILDRLKKS